MQLIILDIQNAKKEQQESWLDFLVIFENWRRVVKNKLNCLNIEEKDFNLTIYFRGNYGFSSKNSNENSTIWCGKGTHKSFHSAGGRRHSRLVDEEWILEKWV